MRIKFNLAAFLASFIVYTITSLILYFIYRNSFTGDFADDWVILFYVVTGFALGDGFYARSRK